MIDLASYIVQEVKQLRLTASDAVALIRQLRSHQSSVEVRPHLTPLLHENDSDLNGQRFSSTFSGAEFYLADHVVSGNKILPGVCYLEMARAAVERSADILESGQMMELRDIVWLKPVMVTDSTEVHIGLSDIGGGEIEFEVYSTVQAGEAGQEDVVHVQGRTAAVAAGSAELLDLPVLRHLCTHTIEATEIYAAFSATGIEYGPAHRGLTSVQVGSDIDGQRFVLAQVTLPACVNDTQDQYVLHPSVLDSALQASIGLSLDQFALASSEREFKPSVPFALERLEIFDRSPTTAWVVVRPQTAVGSIQKLDIEISDEAGRLCVRLQGFTSRLLDSEVNREHRELLDRGLVLMAPSWQPKPLTAVSATVGLGERWVLMESIYKERLPELQTQYPAVNWTVLPQSESEDTPVMAAAQQLFTQVQSILQSKPTQAALLQVVVAEDTQSQTFTTILSGLLKSAHQENPKFLGQIIALRSNATKDEISRAVEENASQQSVSDIEIRYVDGVREVKSFKELNEPITPTSSRPWKAGGVYLITGGAGGLGLIMAEEIASQVDHATLILTGRSELSAAKQTPIDELKQRHADMHIHYRVLDVSDADAVTNCIHAIREQYGSLNGVIHSAGVIHDNFIVKKSIAELQAVLAPKVLGTLNLDHATQSMELDCFILFSSISGAFGSVGQSDYAMANAFMDRYAAYRNQLVEKNQRHGKTLSINWPLWASGGMQVDATTVEQMRRQGLEALTTTDGIDALYRAWRSNESQVIVFAGDRQRLKQLVGLSAPLKATVARKEVLVVEEARDDRVSISHTDLVDKTQQYLKKLLASTLKLTPDRLESDVGFEQYGIDSILALKLVNELELTFGSLPKTLLFEYQSIEALASYFIEHHGDVLNTQLRLTERAPMTARASTSVAINSTPTINPIHKRRRGRMTAQRTDAVQSSGAQANNVADIAIVGMSGRYPGANNVDEFWENLKAGKDCVTEIPKDRWDYREYFDAEKGKVGKSYSKWGGFIEGVDQFDPLFFNISPREAQVMDPQGRLFLETVSNVLEECGYTRDLMRQRHQGKVGVYVGSMYHQYRTIDTDIAIDSLVSLSSYSGIANRVSYFFGFSGPSMAIDTMCSSAAAAIHTACNDLKNGYCQLAVAGAVNLSIGPKKYVGLSQAQLIGSHSDSRSFGIGDGYLPAEAVGAVLLKTLAAARADGDTILAVIKSTATNHSGRSNGYSVPNPNAQAQLIEDCIRNANIDPRSISYVDAAANGSLLGDPIELSALTKAFVGFTSDRQFCAIGSVKSNIGHAEAASGMTQLAKVVLQLRHQQLVPSIKTTPRNPNLNFDNSPFVLQEQLQEWKRPVLFSGERSNECPRRALINSFGAGGSNVCMIVEEFSASAIGSSRDWESSEDAELIILSARTSDRLVEVVNRLLNHVMCNEAISIANLAYTLQVGREAMDSRLALIIRSRQELIQGLQAYSRHADQGHALDKDLAIFIGRVADDPSDTNRLSKGKVGQEIIDLLVKSRDLEKLALFWVGGARTTWNELQREKPGQIIPLPTYPFARDRYWLPGMSASSESQATGLLPAITHPRQPLSNNIKGNAGTLEKIESYITELLAAALGMEAGEISLHRDLKEYGVESIVINNLLRALENEFNQKISGREMLEIRTLSVLARYVAAKITASADPNEGSVQAADYKRNRQGVRDTLVQHDVVESVNRFTDVPVVTLKIPLSVGQNGLFLLQKLNPSDVAYNVPLCLQIIGAVQSQALDGAYRFLLQQHPILGTGIETINDAPWLIGQSLEKLVIAKQRIEGMNDAEVLAFIKNRAKVPFDLNGEPLLRVSLLSRSDKEHWLLFVVHHIVFDGRSVPLLLEAFLGAYHELANGRNPKLRPLPATYGDFVEWERQMLVSEEAEKHRAYWLQQLAKPLSIVRLRADRGRNEGRVNGKSYDLAVTDSLIGKLKSFCLARDISQAVLFLSLYKVLLHRYTNETDINVGMPTLGRPQNRFDWVIGYFINMVPLRSDVSGTSTFSDLLRNVQLTMVDAMDHSAYPFPRIVSDLLVSGERQDAPIFQVGYSYRSAQMMEFSRLQKQDLTGLQIQLVAGIGQEGEYEMVLDVAEHPERIECNLKYDANVFDETTIKRFMDHYERLLEEVIANPDREIGVLPILGESERRQVVETFNATAMEYPNDKLIHELFEEQVAKTPNAIAVVCEEHELTYAELNRKANQLAHYLRERGVGPDQLVAICVERSVEMVVGLLGILKAGGAYVPLDPSYPPDRLTYMLTDALPRIVLTQERLKETLPVSSALVVTLDSEWSAIARFANTNLDAREFKFNSTQLAYVIYTSGSTGQPKGVMVEHRGLGNLAKAQIESFAVQATSRVLQFASFSFDACISEIVMTLSCGASLVIASRERLLPGEPLLAFLRHHRITHVTLPPVAAGTLPLSERVDLSLETMIVAGEACPASLVQQWASSVRFINAYGPTETTVCASMCVCDSHAKGAPPIGRPMSNTQIYILDGHGEPVPVGVTGELYIGGVGVARGYLNRPELTAERFVKDPFSRDATARMYKTGDLGRWRADGNIEYLGRNDHQVKIRGFRIELGEIESCLCGVPQVREAVVVAREDSSGDKRLVAYLTAGETHPNFETLRVELKARLPEYMVPSAFVLLEAMPLTPNGKLDRKALPAPELDAYAVREYAPPQGKVEAMLADIWQELLHVERVGRYDNFFELGGHSLLIMKMIERLRQAGVATTVRSLYNSPTLMALASELSAATSPMFIAPQNLIPAACAAIVPEMLTLIDLKQEEIDRIVQQVPGGAKNIQDIYPLAPLQDGILFHHLINQQADPYVLQLLLSVESRASLDVVLNAFQKVIDRHDILRSAVLWSELPRPLQVVYRHIQFPVEEIALDQMLDPVEQLKARMVLGKLWMDLRVAPLFRAQIAKDPHSERWYVLLRLHHLVGDNMSMGIIQAEISAHLSGQAHHMPSPMAYREYVAQALTQAENNEAEAFFSAKLSDIEEPTLPFGFMDVHGDGSASKEASQALEPELARRVRACAASRKVSAATLFHVAWGLVMARTSGRQDVVFGSVLLGRLQGTAGADRVIGMFINTLPLRLRLSGVSAGQIVEQTHRELIELLKYEQASLSVAKRCSGIDGTAPLFNAVLNYRHSERSTSDVNTQATLPLGFQFLYGLERTNYPFSVSVDDLGEGFSITAQTALVEPERVIEYLRMAMESLVQALERTPEIAALTLEVLPDDERRRVTEEFNATAVAYPQDKLIHELFEEQVAKTPDAIAVAYEDQELTYIELNCKANQLAHYLRERGVGPDQLVAICVERSLEMMIGLLGVLKAGGAYIPLDPNYPRDRLAYMLTDSIPQVVLTQEHLKGILPKTVATVTGLDSEWDAIAKHSSENLDTRKLALTTRHLAYVIYTSGSTGQPKGVMVEHGGLRNYLQWAVREYTPERGAGALVTSSFAFDATVTSLYTPLLCGRNVVLVPDGQELDRLEVLLQDETVWSLVKISPAHLDVLGQRLLTRQQRCSTRAFVIGGEALSPSTVKMWQSISPETRLINEYGPTETVVGCSIYDVPLHWSVNQSVPIGRPISNMRMYILDSCRQPVPIGVAGEIYIGGVGVARGYWNRGDLTAERFLKDPFSNDATARMYKTGDLGRWRSDGNIEYLGRNDHQVKIRGFRIELGEIESCLMGVAAVKEAVVISREDVPGDKRLVAYLTQEAKAPSIDALRAHVKARLPEYMIPSAFVRLEKFPLTQNGKLDRKALPAPELDAYAARQYEAPQGAIEVRLAAIWKELLRVERVGRLDDFFALGGHSLLAVQFIVRAESELKVKIPLSTLFKKSSIAELAASLNCRQHERSISRPKTTIDKVDGLRLFLVHPVGGHGLGYRELADSLQSFGAVHLLERPELADGSAVRFLTTEQLCDAYVDEILTIDNKGPYRLCGWSLGAVLAFHLAVKLESLGKDVAYLGMIDGVASMDHPIVFADDLSEIAGKDVAQELQRCPQPLLDKVLQLWRHNPASQNVGLAHEPSATDQYFHLFVANLWLGRVALASKERLRSRHAYLYFASASLTSEGAMTAAQLTLQRLFREPAKIVQFTGNHFSIMARPIVEEVAKTIDEDVQTSLEAEIDYLAQPSAVALET